MLQMTSLFLSSVFCTRSTRMLQRWLSQIRSSSICNHQQVAIRIQPQATNVIAKTMGPIPSHWLAANLSTTHNCQVSRSYLWNLMSASILLMRALSGMVVIKKGAPSLGGMTDMDSGLPTTSPTTVTRVSSFRSSSMVCTPCFRVPTTTTNI